MPALCRTTAFVQSPPVWWSTYICLLSQQKTPAIFNTGRDHGTTPVSLSTLHSTGDTNERNEGTREQANGDRELPCPHTTGIVHSNQRTRMSIGFHAASSALFLQASCDPFVFRLSPCQSTNLFWPNVLFPCVFHSLPFLFYNFDYEKEFF